LRRWSDTDTAHRFTRTKESDRFLLIKKHRWWVIWMRSDNCNKDSKQQMWFETKRHETRPMFITQRTFSIFHSDFRGTAEWARVQPTKKRLSVIQSCTILWTTCTGRHATVLGKYQYSSTRIEIPQYYSISKRLHDCLVFIAGRVDETPGENFSSSEKVGLIHRKKAYDNIKSTIRMYHARLLKRSALWMRRGLRVLAIFSKKGRSKHCSNVGTTKSSCFSPNRLNPNELFSPKNSSWYCKSSYLK
jgi:hypothetical protein